MSTLAFEDLTNNIISQARVCRSRPKSTGESDALAVSEALPFLEYELARQLMLKLKVIGRNAGESAEVSMGLPQDILSLTIYLFSLYLCLF